ncbi:MAG TPA: universal stress protein [Acidimicrobiia bacterium]|jgi:nucleotide-binding universal stress UspA family protein
MEWTLKVIVAAVDGSESSTSAAKVAADLARLAKAKLILLTAVRTPEGWWGLANMPPEPEALSQALVDGQREVLQGTVEQLDLTGVDYQTAEELGEPAGAILGVLEREHADLLVLGRRGAGLVERVVLGSVADRLAHHSPCPVLIVP